MGALKASIFARYPRTTICVVLASIFILLDFAAGFFVCEKIIGRPDSFYHHDLPANYEGPRYWSRTPYPLVTDSLGFRSSSPRHVTNSSARKRILFIGDSFTEGVGVVYGKTFVGRFEQSVDASKYEVLNAGVISYSPKLYYLKIKYLLDVVGLKFNQLIVFIDISDIQDEIAYEPFVSARLSDYYIVNLLDSFFRKHSATYYFLNKYVFENGIAKSLLNKKPENKKYLISDQEISDNFEIEKGFWADDAEIYDRWGAYGLNLAVENMNNLFELCKENDIDLAIAIYPWPNQIFSKNYTNKHVAAWSKFTSDRNLPLLNLYPMFYKAGSGEDVVTKYFIENDKHWNEEGHKLVFKALSSWWSESGLD